MAVDQQFCLKWNNHQSTLISVFDNLLESETLVDCTIAAEGQYLKAHKVVLSACSPFFEVLLRQHYDKHPIVVLKDVKFQELKCMMDYMYRGEVNISQDQLGALLKAAESLQIKGLSDSGGGTEKEEKRHERRKEIPITARSPPHSALSHSSLTIEQRKPLLHSVPPIVEIPGDSPPPMSSVSREGSISPVARKRRKPRRRTSVGDEASGVSIPIGDASNSVELSGQSIPSSHGLVQLTSNESLQQSVDKKPKLESSQSLMDSGSSRSLLSMPPARSTSQILSSESECIQEVEHALMEPKSEYVEEVTEDSIEDLTLDDMDELEEQAKPGPSHGGGDSGSQGFTPWHVTSDRSSEEPFAVSHEGPGNPREGQGKKKDRKSWTGWSTTRGEMLAEEEQKCFEGGSSSGIRKSGSRVRGIFPCGQCGRTYVRKDSLQRHMQWECGKEPTFQCPFCPLRCKRKAHQIRHIRRQHKDMIEAIEDLSDSQNNSDQSS